MTLLPALVACLAAPLEPPGDPSGVEDPPSHAREEPAPAIPPPTAVPQQRAARPSPAPLSPAPAPAVALTPAPSAPARHRARLPRGWAIDLSGGTSVPISVGAGLQVETPVRVLAQAELGALPNAYLALLDALPGPSRPAAALARDASRRALVVRAAVGVRPLARRGLEVRGGYTGCVLGGGLTSVAVLESVAGADLGADPSTLVDLQSALHGVHTDLGYRFLLRSDLVLRAALGYVQSLGARLTGTYDPALDPDQRARTDGALGAISERAATAALRSPYLTLQLGYRF